MKKYEYKLRMKPRSKGIIYQVYRKVWILPIIKIVYETTDVKKATTAKENLNLINKTT